MNITTANTGTALAATGLEAGTYRVYMEDAAGNLSAATNSSVVVRPNVIDLGVTYGKLMAPVQVESNFYYFWDRDGNGSAGSGDAVTHNVLDSLFQKDEASNTEAAYNAVGTVGRTDNTYRYATLNGVKVALPTYGSTLSGINASPLNVYKNGTASSLNTTADNPTYDDLLAIWDAYNGIGTNIDLSGVPAGWGAGYYWSATPTASGHAVVYLNYGSVLDSFDTNDLYVALQVL
jgi:hypothetical protein